MMNTNYKYIEQLIDKFFEGETSNNEEKELYNFFSNSEIPENLKKYTQIFSYFENDIKNENSQDLTKKVSKKKKIFLLSGIAATISILIISGILLSKNSQNDFFYLEGSYIVRNGVKITDPQTIIREYEILNKELEEQEKNMNELFHNIDKIENELNMEKKENRFTEFKLLSEFAIMKIEINHETNKIFNNN